MKKEIHVNNGYDRNLQTGISSTVVQTVIVFVSKITMVIASLGLQIQLARLLGPNARGAYAVLILFSSSVASLFVLGADRAIQQQVVSEKMSNGEALIFSWVIVFIISILSFLTMLPVIYLGKMYCVGFFKNATLVEFKYSLLLVSPLLLGISLQLLFQANSKFFTSSVVMVLEPIFRFGFITVIYFFFQINLINIISVTFIAGIIVSIIGSIVFLKQVVTIGSLKFPSVEQISQIISYGIRYQPARFGNFIRVHIITLILASIAIASEVGVFAVAIGVAGSCLLIPQSVQSVLQTKILSDNDEYQNMVTKYLRIIGFFSSLIMIFIISILSFLVPVLFGSEYRDASIILWFLLPSLIFPGFSGPLNAYFLCTDRPQIVSLSIIVEITVSVILMIIMYPFFGVYGAALSISFGRLTMFICLLIKFKSICNISYKKIFWPRNSDIRAILTIIDNIKMKFNFRNYKQTEKMKARKLIKSSEYFIKKQTIVNAEIEYEKTVKAALMGVEAGFFYVPEILKYSRDEGKIIFERITEFISLREIIINNHKYNHDLDKIIEQLGISLYHIHRISNMNVFKSNILPIELLNEFPFVFLHGDFTIDNIAFSKIKAPDIVIFDWASSDYVGGNAVFGPALFDLAWFAKSLLFATDNCPTINPVLIIRKLIDSYKNAGGVYGKNSSYSEFNEYFNKILKHQRERIMNFKNINKFKV